MKNRILMLLENAGYPEDSRVFLEARALRDTGYQVTVICPAGDRTQPYEFMQGVHVYRYPKPLELGGFLGYSYEYAYSLVVTFAVSLYVLMKRGFDAVHVHAPPDMYVMIAGFYRLLGKHYVYDQHDLSPELYQAQRHGQGGRLITAALLWFERQACRWADCCIATNQTQRETQIQRCGVSPSRCRVVRNGPDARFLASHAPLPHLRQSGRTVVGYVGMIGVQDGVDHLIRAFDRLCHVLGRDDFLGVVVGTGPALDGIRRQAAELTLNQHVRFAGYLTGTSLLRHLASFDICVTPDPSNAYNDSCTTIKTMEYMAMSKPIVAFDLPEHRYTAANSALYAANNSELEMARLIQRLMDDPAERAAMGQIGHQRIVDRFSWDHQKSHVVAVYDELLRHESYPTRVRATSDDSSRERVRT